MTIYSYPGVYLQETATAAQSIEGVATSTPTADAVPSAPAHTPDWTNHKANDAGRTLVELFAFLGESLVYRADSVPERHSHMAEGARASRDGAVMRFREP